MKNIEEIKEIRSKFNSSELADLKWVQTEIENFSRKDTVSLEGVTALENIMGTLNNFRASYIQRVLNLLKQGNILD